MPERPGERRLAIAVEDHPLNYLLFEGVIPGGEYGAGDVKIADTGTYEPVVWDPSRIEVVLQGVRFTGTFVLVRFRKAGEKEWLVLRAKTCPGSRSDDNL